MPLLLSIQHTGEGLTNSRGFRACETCRSRKQKCDEQRPKCGLCQRMKLDCRYREPQPTKKDKTLVEILDRLKSLEGKVDRLPTSRTPAPAGFGPPQPAPSSQPSFSTELDPSSYSTQSLRTSQQPSPSGPGRTPTYRHASAAHKILTWPVVQQMLLQASPNVGNLKTLEQDGPAFIMQMQRGFPNLPLDEELQEKPFIGMQTQASRVTGATRVTFPALTRDIMHRLATAYFDTFNFVYPFMDRQNFISDTLIKVYTEGFDGDPDSVIALLIFALGDLAIEGSRGQPISEGDGRSSGLRGGSALRPPGLGLFNEARKRMGFVLTECDLENVQIYSLAALYFQACSRHVDFWRMTVGPVDWNSPRGDIIKRAYWHCVIMETALQYELDLAPTGISSLEDRVGMSSFGTTFCEADHRGNQSSHFEAHYASQIALRRLCAEIHNSLYDALSNDTPSGSSDEFRGPSAQNISHLASQLSQWRGMLPKQLQWAEGDPAGFPSPQPVNVGPYNQALDPHLSPQQVPSGSPLFTTDLSGEPVHYPYLYDIQVALLRTRYYYAKYTLYRPFVYKALHFPEQMTHEDAEGVAKCLKSCLKWPLLLSPPSRRKRLIPYLFCWNQHFLGILIILHITQHNQMLREIRANLCGASFEAEIGQSVELMIDWIRDLKICDPIADWCYKILQPIYNLAP
ncbi:related to acetate regulatory DNA binding protein FacB [Phialocephala subalpina]|uniref:Related to acetate regulatory DNA binding protein FacB n=1 Tax=Phialocephala subalpina TaxID=576137 RepID=A0A1L7WD40_9HELO|nr:related to acetate regulatory DNA binding protein FacB [Phialocephala subalpina]